MFSISDLLTDNFSVEMLKLSGPAIFLFGQVEHLTLSFKGGVQFEVVVGGEYPRYRNGKEVLNTFPRFSSNGSSPKKLDVYQEFVVKARNSESTYSESEIAEILTNLMKFVNFMDKLQERKS